jgi:hypothetical protein
MTTEARSAALVTDAAEPDSVETPEERRRTIDELMKLGTYQGMTDEEIERVMTYRERMAALMERNDGAARTIERAQRSAEERANAQYEQAQANFRLACSINPTFRKVVIGDGQA